VHDQSEIAEELPDMLSAETWRNVADAIDRSRTKRSEMGARRQ